MDPVYHVRIRRHYWEEVVMRFLMNIIIDSQINACEPKKLSVPCRKHIMDLVLRYIVLAWNQGREREREARQEPTCIHILWRDEL